MKIAIGSDHLGVELKNLIRDFLKEKEIEINDFGTMSKEPIDYPDIAKKVAKVVATEDYERGILI